MQHVDGGTVLSHIQLSFKPSEVIKKGTTVYPQLENSNPEATRRIQAIAAHDPAFLIVQTVRLLEIAKHNIYALDLDDIIQLISDFRHVSFAPLASLPLGELANELAKHITDPRLAAEIADFEPIEATLLVVALDCFFADECTHPGRPVTLEAIAPFFPVLGIDQA